MKHSTKLVSTLATLALPIAAQAACTRYPDATLTLNMPTTITVPDNLPVGSVITRQTFSGTSEAFFADFGPTLRTIIGRYPRQTDPATGAYQTEAPGVGLHVRLKWADGGPATFGLHSQTGAIPPGRVPSFIAAEALFYKTGPVTDGTVPGGFLWSDRWGSVPDKFTLMLGNSVRFIRPAATCDLAAGDVNRTITLPAIKVSDLDKAVHAGAHNFELIANCSNAANVTFRFSGTPASGNNALFANTGTAKGVALWLYSRINGVPQNISINGERTLAVSGNRAVLPLGAAYHKNGTVSQGALVSTATVNITYN